MIKYFTDIEKIEALKDYYNSSKSTFYSFLFVVPLIMTYELAAFVLNKSDIEGLRNGADVVTKQILSLFGMAGFYALSILVLIILIALFYREMKDKEFNLNYRFLFIMLGESLIYAVLFGFIVGNITKIILQVPTSFSWKHQLVLSLGAGVYEEFLFRVVLISLFSLIFSKVVGLKRITSLGLAVIISSLIFSGFHYVGIFGEPFLLQTFVFRFIGGLVLSILYVTRGYGITAYTHSFYDLFIVAGILG